MDFKVENNNLTIFLCGRIDSANAKDNDDQIDKIVKENAHESLTFDIENLEYISSAGLRVVLRWRKMEPTLTVNNASSEVYDIFEMTGFTEMIPINKAFRKFSVDGCKIIGQGAKGTVYRYNDDTIVKVYKNPDSLPDIKRERELARKAFVLGIPTAISYDIVKVGESYGSVFELLDAKSYSQMIKEDDANKDKYITEFAELLRKIHETPVNKADMPDIKNLAYKWLETAKPFLPEQNFDKLNKLIADVPDTTNMLHFDFHTNNVMNQNGETLLIDMDTLAHGHPVFELGNVYITYIGFGEENPSIVEKFLDLPYSTANYVWKKFLPAYLGTDDAAKIAEVEDKAKLMSYLRFLRHTARRGGADTDAGKKTIALCCENIDKLLKTVDTLDF